VPVSSPTPEITPEITPEPTATPDTLDPAEQHGALAWKFWPMSGSADLGPRDEPSPTAAPTPEPTADPGATGTGDAGLAVVDEVPNLNLLDAIVGGVVATYFGP
jgi:hypothetical protein